MEPRPYDEDAVLIGFVGQAFRALSQNVVCGIIFKKLSKQYRILMFKQNIDIVFCIKK